MIFIFKTVSKLHQTSYESDVRVDLSSSRLPHSSWVAQAVESAASRSNLTRARREVPGGYELVLNSLSTNKEWLRIARLATNELTVETVVAACRHVDGLVSAQTQMSANTKVKLSNLVRSLFKRFALERSVPRISRLSVLYRTPNTDTLRLGRRMISDAVTSDSSTPYPIGATPFSSADELKAKSLQKIDDTLDRIEQAAVQDLEQIKSDRETLEKLISRAAPNPRQVALIQRLSFLNMPTREVPAELRKSEIAQLAASYFSICADAFTPERRGAFQLKCYRGREIVNWLAANGLDVEGTDLGYYFLRPILLNGRALRACLVILLRYTGWNENSVLEMTANGVERLQNGGYIIQGYKTRTSQATPPVEILASDASAIEAVRLLLGRLEGLKRLRWVGQDEVRLWLNGRYARQGRLQPYVGWGSLLKDFIKRHNLPEFSAEQVRVEVLAGRSLLRSGLETARQTAGHAEIRTTAHYLDQLILQRVNSAYALEFERRLEGSVRFRMEPTSTFNRTLDLLYDIGDGSSCVDPSNPPDAKYLEHAVCSGKSCHVGDGCPNRRIVINPRRIEEIVRKQKFYKDNWRSLRNANEQHFQEFDVPAMIVNTALVNILERSAHRSTFKIIRGQIYGED